MDTRPAQICYREFSHENAGKKFQHRKTGKAIMKSAAYWAISSGRLRLSELLVSDRPGWKDGKLINDAQYIDYLQKIKY